MVIDLILLNAENYQWVSAFVEAVEPHMAEMFRRVSLDSYVSIHLLADGSGMYEVSLQQLFDPTQTFGQLPSTSNFPEFDDTLDPPTIKPSQLFQQTGTQQWSFPDAPHDSQYNDLFDKELSPSPSRLEGNFFAKSPEPMPRCKCTEGACKFSSGESSETLIELVGDKIKRPRRLTRLWSRRDKEPILKLVSTLPLLSKVDLTVSRLGILGSWKSHRKSPSLRFWAKPKPSQASPPPFLPPRPPTPDSRNPTKTSDYADQGVVIRMQQSLYFELVEEDPTFHFGKVDEILRDNGLLSHSFFDNPFLWFYLRDCSAFNLVPRGQHSRLVEKVLNLQKLGLFPTSFEYGDGKRIFPELSTWIPEDLIWAFGDIVSRSNYQLPFFWIYMVSIGCFRWETGTITPHVVAAFELIRWVELHDQPVVDCETCVRERNSKAKGMGCSHLY